MASYCSDTTSFDVSQSKQCATLTKNIHKVKLSLCAMHLRSGGGAFFVQFLLSFDLLLLLCVHAMNSVCQRVNCTRHECLSRIQCRRHALYIFTNILHVATWQMCAHAIPHERIAHTDAVRYSKMIFIFIICFCYVFSIFLFTFSDIFIHFSLRLSRTPCSVRFLYNFIALSPFSCKQNKFVCFLD